MAGSGARRWADPAVMDGARRQATGRERHARIGWMQRWVSGPYGLAGCGARGLAGCSSGRGGSWPGERGPWPLGLPGSRGGGGLLQWVLAFLGRLSRIFAVPHAPTPGCGPGHRPGLRGWGLGIRLVAGLEAGSRGPDCSPLCTFGPKVQIPSQRRADRGNRVEAA